MRQLTLQSFQHLTTSDKFHYMKAIKKNNTYIFAKTYPTIFPFSSSAIYDSWKTNRTAVHRMMIQLVLQYMVLQRSLTFKQSRSQRWKPHHCLSIEVSVCLKISVGHKPVARTGRGRSSTSSDSSLEDTAGCSAACSSDPLAGNM